MEKVIKNVKYGVKKAAARRSLIHFFLFGVVGVTVRSNLVAAGVFMSAHLRLRIGAAPKRSPAIPRLSV